MYVSRPPGAELSAQPVSYILGECSKHVAI